MGTQPADLDVRQEGLSEMGKTVFLSYGREDTKAARRMYRDLTSIGIDVWFDRENLLAGELWERAALNAIGRCQYVIALLSTRSVSRKGFVNRELRKALELLEEYPENSIFLITVRLDSCTPSHTRLAAIHRVDMFPSWKDGLDQIFKSLRIINEELLSTEQVRRKLTTNYIKDGPSLAILRVLATHTQPYSVAENGWLVPSGNSDLAVSLEYDEVVDYVQKECPEISDNVVYSLLNELTSNGLLLSWDKGGDGQEEPLRVYVALKEELRASVYDA